MKNLLISGATLWLVLATSPLAAHPFTVKATDDIYSVDMTSDPYGGTVPTQVLKIGRKTAYITVKKITGSLSCSPAAGCITLNSGGNLNDANGVGAAPATSSNTGTSDTSGITAPYAGYLVGLFTTKAGPSGTAPPALDFTTGEGTAFTSLSPMIDQTFFIGDGRTGDGKGRVQTFVVPAGAKQLWLGISDACNYNGSPGCYSDNSGTYTVTLEKH